MSKPDRPVTTIPATMDGRKVLLTITSPTTGVIREVTGWGVRELPHREHGFAASVEEIGSLLNGAQAKVTVRVGGTERCLKS